MARTKQEARKSTGKSTWSPKPGAMYIAKKSASIEVKRPYRHRPGTVALREIRKFQGSPDPLIPRMSFERLVREIAQGFNVGFRFEASSIDALQQAAESYVVGLFEGANICAIHAKRVTVKVGDLRLAREFKGDRL